MSGETKEGIMLRIKVKLWLTETALTDFKAVQKHPNEGVASQGETYLKRLLELSPRHWIRVHELWDRGLFVIRLLSPFDIRGQVRYSPSSRTVRVYITHFKLREEAPKGDLVGRREPELLKELFGLHDVCVSNEPFIH
jgi:hypothetical protein